MAQLKNNTLIINFDDCSSANEFNLLAQGSIQTFFASILLNELIRNNVNYFVVSPGARAIPLVLALNIYQDHFYENNLNKIKVDLINDERAAAFIAQGYRKGSFHKGNDTIPALICTSGTAVANYLPGVVEAYYSKSPILIITTDRPWELQNANANQTINQKDIFKDFVSLKIDISAPEKFIHPHSLLSTINQLVSVARLSKQPVHLNLAFRKPFYNDGFDPSQDLNEPELSIISEWWKSNKRYVDISDTLVGSSDSELLPDFSSQKDNLSANILFIVGGGLDINKRKKLIELSCKLNIPMFLDVFSNLRQLNLENGFSLYNRYLNKLENISFDNIYYFGDRIVSDLLANFLVKKNSPITQISDSVYRQDAIETNF